jgi:hypothetical protein
VRRAPKDPDRAKAELKALDLTERELSTLRHSDGTAYVVTNFGTEARRLRARIAELQAQRQREPAPDVVVGEVTIRETVDRLQVIFPGKPCAEVRSSLKHSGFRWAPSEGAWQRRPSYQAREAALRIAAEVRP